MDRFTHTYLKILENLDSSLLATTNGMYGNSLTMSDFWNTSDNRIAYPIALATRNGRRNKSKKRKKRKNK